MPGGCGRSGRSAWWARARGGPVAGGRAAAAGGGGGGSGRGRAAARLRRRQQRGRRRGAPPVCFLHGSAHSARSSVQCAGHVDTGICACRRRWARMREGPVPVGERARGRRGGRGRRRIARCGARATSSAPCAPSGSNGKSAMSGRCCCVLGRWPDAHGLSLCHSQHAKAVSMQHRTRRCLD